MAQASRQQALRIAQRLGCYGAHQNEDGLWMPCATPDEFSNAVKGGKTEQPHIELKSALSERIKKKSSISETRFESRADAEKFAKENNCQTIRTINSAGKKFYVACQSSRRSNNFEQLGERGVLSIETLPSGGIISGKSCNLNNDITPIDAKGFVNYVSRSTDPDVFSDPDSARVRARQLGCIGIRSYTARDGKTVYLPCTNGSDYNRVMNLRPDGAPKKRVNKKSLAKTPAPKKDRIIGSKRNKVGSARSVSSGSEIFIDDAITEALIKKVRDHNKTVSDKKKDSWSLTNLRTLKSVYRRGAGAFSISHRPGMTRNQWAMGRVNAFLELLITGKAKASYTTDNDLLPQHHPWKKKTIGQKTVLINGVEYRPSTTSSNPNYGVRYTFSSIDNGKQ